MFESVEIKPFKCPACGEVIDCQASAGQHKPSPGDYTICAYCANIQIFLPDLTTREVTPELDPFFILSPEYRLLKITAIKIKQFHASRRDKTSGN